MLKEITFKTALAVSLSLHLLLLSPWGALRLAKMDDKETQIEVTYILEEFIKAEFEKEIENLPQKYDLEEKKLEEAKGKAEKLAEKKTLAQAKVPEKEEKYLTKEEVEKLEEYISYYELIREKIKKNVTRHYRRYATRGRVDVIFKLGKNGALKKMDLAEVGASQSRYLNKIALKAVKSASPFPPFPAALKKEELTFTISIIFKRE